MVGEPLHPGRGETIAGLTQRLRTTLSALLEDALDTYPDAPRSDADRWWLPHSRGGTAPEPAVAAALDRAALERINQPVD
jgi:hypothetical protein